MTLQMGSQLRKVSYQLLLPAKPKVKPLLVKTSVVKARNYAKPQEKEEG